MTTGGMIVLIGGLTERWGSGDKGSTQMLARAFEEDSILCR